MGAKEIVIGVVAPMTGDVATFGQSTKQGVELAIKQINDKGGINGKKVVMKAEDDRNDPVEAANAALKLITKDKVHGIVGSVASKCTLAAAPIAQQHKVPLISGTSTNVKVTQVGDFIFRACFIDPFQGLVMAKFARENLQKNTAAVLFDIGNDYTKGLAEQFKANFEKLGGTIVAYETYGKGDQDFNAQLTKIKSANPAILFLPDYYNTVGLVAKQARAQGITAVFLGGDGWDSADLVKIGGDAVEGGFFSNHYSPDSTSPEAQAFRAAYEAAYKATPDALAALAFDAANILMDSIKRANSVDGTKIRDAMKATKDFKAVSGNVNFDAHRNPIKGAVIIKVQGGKQVFEAVINP
jgi:branched-chain amino acid transport system substrate-binding protein